MEHEGWKVRGDRIDDLKPPWVVTRSNADKVKHARDSVCELIAVKGGTEQRHALALCRADLRPTSLRWESNPGGVLGDR